jgi:SAM-dependent methyltransferase
MIDRAVKEAEAHAELTKQAQALNDASLEFAERSRLYRGRGLSSDTSVRINLALDGALARIKAAGHMTRIRRVGIIGPGLDVVDKQEGYDFYPPQTIQPFAVIDSLRRADLAADGVQVAAFDVSPRVLRHIEDARARARNGRPYALVLPYNLERGASAEFVAYWERFGNWIGAEAKPPPAPPSAGKVGVRGVDVRPDVVLAVTAGDLNIVLQRPPGGTPFDLVVATNVLLYYDVFEQSLALSNIASMLRPGGLLLTNTRLVELPGVAMTSVGYTDTVYTSLPGVGETGDRMYWYQRQ